ncbi:MAG: RodZ domain-containing protein [Candidatus Brachytrichaceae bacterium NZ_4S206]|jgi:cytoskeletal protein RodZ
MPSELAQRIRDARTARAITLDEAESATKIRRKYLEAIEAGDFAQLPDGPPGRGFVKNYARYLGLDPEAAIKLFEAEVGVPVLMLRDPAPPPPVRHKPVSRLTQVALPEPRAASAANEHAASKNALADGVHASLQQAVVRRDGTTGKAVVMTITRPLRASGSSFRLKNIRGPFAEYDPNMMSARGPKQPFSAMPRPSWVERYLPYGLGALAIAGVLVFFALVVVPAASEWISATLPPQTQAATASEPEFVPQVTIFAPQPTRAPTIADQPAPASAPPANEAAAPAEQPFAPAQPVPISGLQLALDARERAWVRVKVDGNVVFEGIPPIGPGIPFSANQNIQVETGNAGAFDIILNNVRLGPLGARNETVVKTWNASGP